MQRQMHDGVKEQVPGNKLYEIDCELGLKNQVILDKNVEGEKD